MPMIIAGFSIKLFAKEIDNYRKGSRDGCQNSGRDVRSTRLPKQRTRRPLHATINSGRGVRSTRLPHAEWTARVEQASRLLSGQPSSAVQLWDGEALSIQN